MGNIKPKTFVDVEYHQGVMAGTNCRWTLVFGFTVNTEYGGNCDCVVFSAKPTKKQIRFYRKEARKWLEFMKVEWEYEDILIDVLGSVGA